MYIYVLSHFSFVQMWSVIYQVVPQGWRFDGLSFVIGLAVAFFLVGLAYRRREQIAQLRDQAQAKVGQLRQRLTASMADRYNSGVVERVQVAHLLGRWAPLEEIYVETKLEAPLSPAAEEAERPLLSPVQASRASDRLAIIGEPGSGRTTLLNRLQLFYVRRLEGNKQKAPVPLYIYLPALTEFTQADENGATAEQLVQTAVAFMARVVATGVARWLRGQVEKGNALILLDGWDEVPTAERPAITAWIQALAADHPDNRLIVTAGERGYAPLVEAGFVPLRPRPWTPRQLADLARRCATALPVDNSAAPPPALSARLKPPTPFEATLELVTHLNRADNAPSESAPEPARTPAVKMAHLINLLLPPPPADEHGQTAWPLATGHRALGRLALATIERGQPVLTREKIQSTVTEALPPSRFDLDDEQIQDLAKEDQKAAEAEKEQRRLQVVDCCRALTDDGAPIQTLGNQRYFFTYPLVTAYLAARHLAETDAQGAAIAVAHADDPAWRDLLRFYAGMAPAEPVIQRLLNTPDDLFMNRLWTAAALLAAAPNSRAPWRQGLIKRLAQLFMNPRLPQPLRNRALMALLESGETGLGQLFKQAVRHPNTQVRAGAVFGLGALGREQDIDLIQAGLSDEPQVQLETVYALRQLCLLGSEAALELIVAIMVEGDAELQRLAAETLSELGQEGHTILQEGARDPDLTVRRAVVYGLTAVGEPWAIELLQELQQDGEWLVRNAAIEALDQMDLAEDQELEKEPALELTLAQPETEAWLISWAAERGEGTGTGEAALATLTRALVQGDASTRYSAAETLYRLADPNTVGALRHSLRDPEPAVRDMALAALEEISRRHDVAVKIRD